MRTIRTAIPKWMRAEVLRRATRAGLFDGEQAPRCERCRIAVADCDYLVWLFEGRIWGSDKALFWGRFHHIQAVRDGGNHSPDNLALLCGDCHTDWHRFYEGKLVFPDFLVHTSPTSDFIAGQIKEALSDGERSC